MTYAICDVESTSKPKLRELRERLLANCATNLLIRDAAIFGNRLMLEFSYSNSRNGVREFAALVQRCAGRGEKQAGDIEITHLSFRGVVIL